jgi:hypothetical protein
MAWAGEGDWRDEFERFCALTGSAARLNQTELERLIAESNGLLERIAVEGGAEGKVYLFRLRKCRDFFVFMRDSGSRESSGEIP